MEMQYYVANSLIHQVNQYWYIYINQLNLFQLAISSVFKIQLKHIVCPQNQKLYLYFNFLIIQKTSWLYAIDFVYWG